MDYITNRYNAINICVEFINVFFFINKFIYNINIYFFLSLSLSLLVSLQLLI